jgi:hypothetical protein
MARLISTEELRELLASPPAKTQTYETEAPIAERTSGEDGAWRGRLMTDPEIEELAKFLEVPASLLVGPFEVDDLVCQQCGRHVTFLDFAKSGVDQGAHSVASLGGILTSRDKAWVTVVGRDGGRPIMCVGCGARLGPRPEIDEGYKSGAYDYKLPLR